MPIQSPWFTKVKALVWDAAKAAIKAGLDAVYADEMDQSDVKIGKTEYRFNCN